MAVVDVDVCWFEDDEWRGFLLVEPRSELLQRHVFDIWVAGIHHYPGAAERPDFAPGRPLTLLPNPDNPYDPDAIGVWNEDQTVQVGHIPAVIIDQLTSADRMATSLSQHFDESHTCINLRVLVSREPASLVDLSDCATMTAWKRSTVKRLKKQAALLKDPWPAQDDPVDQMARMLEDLKGKDD